MMQFKQNILRKQKPKLYHCRPCGGDCSAQQQVPRQCEHKSSQVGRENWNKAFRQIQSNGGKDNGSVGAVGNDVVDNFLTFCSAL